MSQPPSPSSSSSAPAAPINELTPRSKVKALLAQFEDEDSDTSPLKPVAAPLTSIPLKSLASSPSASPSEDDSNSDKDSASDRPVGRMAARMKARNAGTTAKGTSSKAQSVTSTPSKQRSSSLPQSSPGLFVSPARDGQGSSDSDSEMSDTVLDSTNNKLKELLARKRSERKAERRTLKRQQKEREAQRIEKIASDAADLERVVASEDDDNDDVKVRKTLTQSRPARKASKKALDQMNQETQRLAREQNLAHQAKVKKTYRTKDFMAFFNARTKKEEVSFGRSSDDEFTMSGALASSDTEQPPKAQDETPATSPSPVTDAPAFKMPPPIPATNVLDKLEAKVVVASEEAPVDKSTVTTTSAQETIVASVTLVEQAIIRTPEKSVKKAKKVRIVLPVPTKKLDDSDDDLEITDERRAAHEIFNHIPKNQVRENNSYRNLRGLANLTSPSRKKPNVKGAMTMNELKFNLQAKARQQAIKEREDRINEARARGVYVPTAEERERDAAEIFSIEKAREEALLLAKVEREEAQKNGESVDDDGLLESEDEEYAAEESGSEGEMEASEEEEEEEEEENESTHDDDAVNPFLDEEADDGEEEAQASESESVAVTEASPKKSAPNSPPAAARNKPRSRKIIDDDDDDEEEENDEEAALKAAAAFGFGQNSNNISLSQAFAGTFANSGSQQFGEDDEEESLAALREFMPGTIPEFENFATLGDKLVQDSQDDRIVLATQPESFPLVNMGISQFTSQLLERSPSKAPELTQLTQDAGFVAPREPAGIEAVQSTVDTLPLHSQTQNSHKPAKRSRLKRRSSMRAIMSDSENEPLQIEAELEDEVEPTKDAYDVLFKQAKRQQKIEEFNKKKSAAKSMFQEQAEESEDEYQGLGGASDDDSDDEMDEEVAQMIDHGPVKVDERAMAAFHAEKERKDDEKNLEKLYKDITTGGLRKRRGGDLDDLDDSDDERMERVRRKQEENARMRRALLADERIGKIAENPKQKAFFHAIEDLEAPDDWLFHEDSIQVLETQGSQDEQEPEKDNLVQTVSLKRKSTDDLIITSSAKENLPPGDDQTSGITFKKPKLSDIRDQLSFLTEDSIIPDSQRLLSDDEDDLDIDFGLTRTTTSLSVDSNNSRASIVNRLVRCNDIEENDSQPLAFNTGGSKSSSGFKIPSLLRRATNLSTTSESSNSTKTSNGSNDKSMRLGGSKKSNIHYQAHEAERRKVVDAADSKRKAQLKRTVMAVKGRSIIGTLSRNNSGFE